MEKGIRKLAALMFTDIVGYSALSEADERLALELLEEHRQRLRSLFSKFGGCEIKTIGDAFLVEFASAVEAVRCAVDIQKEFHERNVQVEENRRIRLRIGLHLGDVVHEAGDVLGEGVNIASRVVAQAEPDGVCITQPVCDQVRQKLEFRIKGMGPRRLKNIRMPMELYYVELPWTPRPSRIVVLRRGIRPSLILPGILALAAVIFAGLWIRTHRGASFEPGSAASPSAPTGRGIAVLPLADFSADPGEGYYADGMTEALITDLAKVGELKVISRTSVMRYKGTRKSLPEIARELEVDTILEGSITRAGRTVQISAKLLEALTDRVLWAESYERDGRDILSLQREVARAVAQAVQVRLSPQEETSLARARSVDPAAHDAYLKGLYHWNRRTRADVGEAIRLFEEAVRLDPAYAPPYAGLAGARIVMADWGFEDPKIMFAGVPALAEKALALDPTLAEAHAVMGGYHLQAWRWDRAEEEFRTAIRLNPGYATAHQWYAEMLGNRGRFTQALSEAQKARDLDPLSLIVNAILGSVYYQSRRYGDAVAQLEKTRAMDPDSFMAHGYLWYTFIQTGEYDRGAAEYREILRTMGAPSNARAAFDAAWAKAGIRGVWRWLVDEGVELLPQPYSRPYYCAEYLALLGEKQKALDRLDQAFEIGAPNLAIAPTDPALDSLRDEPRFKALLKKMGLKDPPAAPNP
jgi:adenylate cyclase